MNRQQTLSWLANLQRDFGAALRTPLDPRSGELRAAPADYPQSICDAVVPSLQRMAADRLGIYNRQYWFRLLRTLQDALPLTCHLEGAWYFNQLAMSFLQAHPPKHHDLARAADGFDAFLERQLRAEAAGGGVPSVDGRAGRVEAGCVSRCGRVGEALVEAARLDAAFRRVAFAPPQPGFRLSAGVSVASQISFSAAHARFTEHWPLLQLRARCFREKPTGPVGLPERLPCAQTWALFRTARGVGHVLLAPLHARLLVLLEAYPLGEALGRLEAECPDDELDALPERVRRWLERSAKLGFFTGAEPTQPHSPRSGAQRVAAAAQRGTHAQDPQR